MKSKQPRKQRKFLYTAPLHRRRKMVASHLSKDLRQRFKRRSMPLRKGDEIEVMTGKFAGKKSKVLRIDYKFYQVFVDGVMIKRTDGTERQAPLHASNLKITSLNLTDKKRIKVLERKGKVEIPKQPIEEKKKEEKPKEEKPKEEKKPEKVVKKPKEIKKPEKKPAKKAVKKPAKKG